MTTSSGQQQSGEDQREQAAAQVAAQDVRDRLGHEKRVARPQEKQFAVGYRECIEEFEEAEKEEYRRCGADHPTPGDFGEGQQWATECDAEALGCGRDGHVQTKDTADSL